MYRVHCIAMGEWFCAMCDDAGGAAVSEPVQQIHQSQPGQSASLHPSSQAAQPTASGSQSGG
jgi:hypothetical protein